MGLNTDALNTAANAVAAEITHMSLHSADPGATGANELSGGSPAYARKPVSWNAAASGGADSSNTQVFDVPAGSDVAYVGFWTAVTDGEFRGSEGVTVESFAEQGTYTVDDADINFT